MAHIPDTTAKEKPAELSARQLHRRYIVALSLIALLTILSQILVQYLIADQVHDSRVVNIAGRQRMLSQKITKSGFYIVHATSPSSAAHYREQLSQSLLLWQRSHRGLQEGDKEMGLPGNNSEEIKALFQGIEPNHQAMIAAARTILTTAGNETELNKSIDLLRQNEASFLDGMDAIVFRYDHEAKTKVGIARWLELILMCVTLVVLVLEALLIFAPAVRRIRRDVQTLSGNEQDMTRLFDANPNAMLMVRASDLTILRANDKAQLLAKPEDILQSQSLLESVLHAHYDVNKNFMEKLRGDKILNEFEVALLDTNHEVIEFLVSSRLIQFNEQQTYVLGFTNINELKKAQQSLEYYATYDELTGLVNRRTGLVFLEKSMALAWRENTPLSIVYADLDGLKAANDKFGHAEGDRLLRAAANIMTGLIRSSDFAVRLGGDEFLIILPNCPEHSAQRVVENLEHLLASIKNDTPHKTVYTISCGIVLFDSARHQSADELLAEADQRMHSVKQAKKATI